MYVSSLLFGAKTKSNLCNVIDLRVLVLIVSGLVTFCNVFEIRYRTIGLYLNLYCNVNSAAKKRCVTQCEFKLDVYKI